MGHLSDVALAGMPPFVWKSSLLFGPPLVLYSALMIYGLREMGFSIYIRIWLHRVHSQRFHITKHQMWRVDKYLLFNILILFVAPFVITAAWSAVLGQDAEYRDFVPPLALSACTLLFFVMFFFGWRLNGWRMRRLTKGFLAMSILCALSLMLFLSYSLSEVTFFGRSVFFLSLSLAAFYSTICCVYGSESVDEVAYLDADLSYAESLLQSSLESSHSTESDAAAYAAYESAFQRAVKVSATERYRASELSSMRIGFLCACVDFLVLIAYAIVIYYLQDPESDVPFHKKLRGLVIGVAVIALDLFDFLYVLVSASLRDRTRREVAPWSQLFLLGFFRVALICSDSWFLGFTAIYLVVGAVLAYSAASRAHPCVTDFHAFSQARAIVQTSWLRDILTGTSPTARTFRGEAIQTIGVPSFVTSAAHFQRLRERATAEAQRKRSGIKGGFLEIVGRGSERMQFSKFLAHGYSTIASSDSGDGAAFSSGLDTASVLPADVGASRSTTISLTGNSGNLGSSYLTGFGGASRTSDKAVEEASRYGYVKEGDADSADPESAAVAVSSGWKDKIRFLFGHKRAGAGQAELMLLLILTIIYVMATVINHRVVTIGSSGVYGIQQWHIATGSIYIIFMLWTTFRAFHVLKSGHFTIDPYAIRACFLAWAAWVVPVLFILFYVYFGHVTSRYLRRLPILLFTIPPLVAFTLMLYIQCRAMDWNLARLPLFRRDSYWRSCLCPHLHLHPDERIALLQIILLSVAALANAGVVGYSFDSILVGIAAGFLLYAAIAPIFAFGARGGAQAFRGQDWALLITSLLAHIAGMTCLLYSKWNAFMLSEMGALSVVENAQHGSEPVMTTIPDPGFMSLEASALIPTSFNIYDAAWAVFIVLITMLYHTFVFGIAAFADKRLYLGQGLMSAFGYVAATHFLLLIVCTLLVFSAVAGIALLCSVIFACWIGHLYLRWSRASQAGRPLSRLETNLIIGTVMILFASSLAVGIFLSKQRAEGAFWIFSVAWFLLVFVALFSSFNIITRNQGTSLVHTPPQLLPMYTFDPKTETLYRADRQAYVIIVGVIAVLLWCLVCILTARATVGLTVAAVVNLSLLGVAWARVLTTQKEFHNLTSYFTSAGVRIARNRARKFLENRYIIDTTRFLKRYMKEYPDSGAFLRFAQMQTRDPSWNTYHDQGAPQSGVPSRGDSLPRPSDATVTSFYPSEYGVGAEVGMQRMFSNQFPFEGAFGLAKMNKQIETGVTPDTTIEMVPLNSETTKSVVPEHRITHQEGDSSKAQLSTVRELEPLPDATVTTNVEFPSAAPEPDALYDTGLASRRLAGAPASLLDARRDKLERARAMAEVQSKLDTLLRQLDSVDSANDGKSGLPYLRQRTRRVMVEEGVIYESDLEILDEALKAQTALKSCASDLIDSMLKSRGNRANHEALASIRSKLTTSHRFNRQLHISPSVMKRLLRAAHIQHLVEVAEQSCEEILAVMKPIDKLGWRVEDEIRLLEDQRATVLRVLGMTFFRSELDELRIKLMSKRLCETFFHLLGYIDMQIAVLSALNDRMRAHFYFLVCTQAKNRALEDAALFEDFAAWLMAKKSISLPLNVTNEELYAHLSNNDIQRLRNWKVEFLRLRAHSEKAYFSYLRTKRYQDAQQQQLYHLANTYCKPVYPTAAQMIQLLSNVDSPANLIHHNVFAYLLSVCPLRRAQLPRGFITLLAALLGRPSQQMATGLLQHQSTPGSLHDVQDQESQLQIEVRRKQLLSRLLESLTLGHPNLSGQYTAYPGEQVFWDGVVREPGTLRPTRLAREEKWCDPDFPASAKSFFSPNEVEDGEKNEQSLKTFTTAYRQWISDLIEWNHTVNAARANHVKAAAKEQAQRAKQNQKKASKGKSKGAEAPIASDNTVPPALPSPPLPPRLPPELSPSRSHKPKDPTAPNITTNQTWSAPRSRIKPSDLVWLRPEEYLPRLPIWAFRDAATCAVYEGMSASLLITAADVSIALHLEKLKYFQQAQAYLQQQRQHEVPIDPPTLLVSSGLNEKLIIGTADSAAQRPLPNEPTIRIPPPRQVRCMQDATPKELRALVPASLLPRLPLRAFLRLASRGWLTKKEYRTINFPSQDTVIEGEEEKDHDGPDDAGTDDDDDEFFAYDYDDDYEDARFDTGRRRNYEKELRALKTVVDDTLVPDAKQLAEQIKQRTSRVNPSRRNHPPTDLELLGGLDAGATASACASEPTALLEGGLEDLDTDQGDEKSDSESDSEYPYDPEYDFEDESLIELADMSAAELMKQAVDPNSPLFQRTDRGTTSSSSNRPSVRADTIRMRSIQRAAAWLAFRCRVRPHVARFGWNLGDWVPNPVVGNEGLFSTLSGLAYSQAQFEEQIISTSPELQKAFTAEVRRIQTEVRNWQRRIFMRKRANSGPDPVHPTILAAQEKVYRADHSARLRRYETYLRFKYAHKAVRKIMTGLRSKHEGPLASLLQPRLVAPAVYAVTHYVRGQRHVVYVDDRLPFYRARLEPFTGAFIPVSALSVHSVVESVPSSVLQALHYYAHSADQSQVNVPLPAPDPVACARVLGTWQRTAAVLERESVRAAIQSAQPAWATIDGYCPAFMHSADPRDIWLPIVEKAYAKLHMYYQSLYGGLPAHSLEVYGNGLVNQIFLKGYSAGGRGRGSSASLGKWMNAKDDPTSSAVDNQNTEALWATITRHCQDGATMLAVTSDSPAAPAEPVNVTTAETTATFGFTQLDSDGALSSKDPFAYLLNDTRIERRQDVRRESMSQDETRSVSSIIERSLSAWRKVLGIKDDSNILPLSNLGSTDFSDFPDLGIGHALTHQLADYIPSDAQVDPARARLYSMIPAIVLGQYGAVDQSRTANALLTDPSARDSASLTQGTPPGRFAGGRPTRKSRRDLDSRLAIIASVSRVPPLLNASAAMTDIELAAGSYLNAVFMTDRGSNTSEREGADQSEEDSAHVDHRLFSTRTRPTPTHANLLRPFSALWLQAARQRRFGSMTCSTVPPTSTRPCLFSPFAFVILDAVSILDTHLLRLRSCGRVPVAWTGAWNANDSQHWTRLYKSRVPPERHVDGSFWISFHDFLLHFGQLYVSIPRTNWIVRSHVATWSGDATKGITSCPYGPQFTFALPGLQRMAIRIGRSNATRELLSQESESGATLQEHHIADWISTEEAILLRRPVARTFRFNLQGRDSVEDLIRAANSMDKPLTPLASAASEQSPSLPVDVSRVDAPAIIEDALVLQPQSSSYLWERLVATEITAKLLTIPDSAKAHLLRGNYDRMGASQGNSIESPAASTSTTLARFDVADDDEKELESKTAAMDAERIAALLSQADDPTEILSTKSRNQLHAMRTWLLRQRQMVFIEVRQFAPPGVADWQWPEITFFVLELNGNRLSSLNQLVQAQGPAKEGFAPVESIHAVFYPAFGTMYTIVPAFLRPLPCPVQVQVTVSSRGTFHFQPLLDNAFLSGAAIAQGIPDHSTYSTSDSRQVPFQNHRSAHIGAAEIHL